MVVAHQRVVYAFALQLTGNHEDAEDLSQEFFIKAHQMLDSFRGDGSMRGWLFRITANRYLSGRRKKSLAYAPSLGLEEHAAFVLGSMDDPRAITPAIEKP